jgi:hypothetical protein
MPSRVAAPDVIGAARAINPRTAAPEHLEDSIEPQPDPVAKP